MRIRSEDVMVELRGEARDLPVGVVTGASTPPEEGPQTVPLRMTRDRRQLDAWSLVLVSRGLSPLRRSVDGSFELHVSPGESARAAAELDAFDAEERERERAVLVDLARDEPPATRYSLLGGVLMSLLLVGFFAVTGPRASASGWFSAGAANAALVLEGEWWRAVTALTLHADSAHVLSNVGLGAFVVSAVMRSEGLGVGAALVLAAGTLGNLINAAVHQAHHSSVGFSTAVFGAIGLLGGLGYVRGQRRMIKLRPAWTALGGSLALLAMLGMGGGRTDVLAHVFGGLAGVGLGLLVGFSGLRASTFARQAAAGLASVALVMGSWLVALG